jgi:hypothetical protein
MGQDTLVSDELENGRKLVERLIEGGLDVRLAFWVKESDAGQWFLYLVSPVVDEKGPAAAYRALVPLMEQMPELGIDPSSVKLVGMNDSAAAKAWEVIRPRIPHSPFAVHGAKPYPGMTRFGGETFAGMNVEGVYIYPPFQAA